MPRNRQRITHLLVALSGFVALMAMFSTARADDPAAQAPPADAAAPVVTPPPPPKVTQGPVSTADGETSFRRYCASCHGKAGKGDGQLAGSLRQAPVDLTTLAARKGGFVAKDIAAMIDGTKPVAAHGEDMPKWGEAFAYGETSADRQQEVDRKIAELVAYIETLQAKH